MNSPEATRWTTRDPALGTGPLDPAAYTSRDYFEQLRDKVFRRSWLATGRRVEQIPQSGDYLVVEMEMFSSSALIVRGKDGELRAFHNICTHRANRLAKSASGHCRGGFVCGYHGWAFTTDGNLASVPEEEMFFDLDRDKYGLVPLAVGTWQGFIFIHMEAQPQITLAEHLGDIVDQVEGYGFADLPVALSYTTDQMACSWGAVRDSQLEGYHVKYLHRRTLPGSMHMKDDPSRHVLDVKFFGQHATASFYGTREGHVPAQVESIANQFGSTLGNTPTQLLDPNLWPVGINPTRSADWVFDICFIFPNLHIVFLGPTFYVAHTMWPVDEGHAVWNARGYLPPATNAAEQFNREYAKCNIRDLWLEDGATLEVTQQGLASGVLKDLPVQDQEVLIRHTQRSVDEMIAQG